MKPMRIIYLCLLLVSALSCFAGDQKDSSHQSGISYQVYARANYSDPEDVELDFVIENKSRMSMVVVLNGLDRIQLVGPDGNPVPPYPYRPSGMGARMYAIECYPPGGRCERKLRLSALFPFPAAGIYRATLSQRVYQWTSPEVPNKNDLFDSDYYGTPIDVKAEEITFQVEKPTPVNREIPKIDPQNGFNEPGLEYNPMDSKKYPVRGEGHYKRSNQEAVKTKASSLAVSSTVPPLAQAPAPKKAPEAAPTTSAPSEEPTSSMPWSIIVVLIVVTIGLLWLLLKRRS